MDAQGRFAPPPVRTLARCDSAMSYYDSSLRRSLEHFLGVVVARARFPLAEFDQALVTTTLLLQGGGKAEQETRRVLESRSVLR